MAEIIWQYAKDDTPTLLEVDTLDSGFYTASGIIPALPFFCVLNISHDILPNMRDSQKNAVRNGDNEFVIIHTTTKETCPNEDYWQFENHYALLTTLHGTSANDERWYHLYQRISESNEVVNSR
jgi:hypothetical protein